MMRNPRTPAEWQAAVNAATALRLIADCRMYGLIEGGPSIDVDRCDEIVDLGNARGVQPSAPALDLALEYIGRLNYAIRKRHGTQAQHSHPNPDGAATPEAPRD